jgi:hypothetical protein
LSRVAWVSIGRGSGGSGLSRRSRLSAQINSLQGEETYGSRSSPTTDAGLMFIGRIRTPWTSRMETPRQGRADGPMCRIEVSEPWVPALAGLAQYERVEVLYWLRPDLAASYLIAQMHGMGPDGASPAVEHKGPAMSAIKGGPRSRDQGADPSVEPGSDAEICLHWNAFCG